jgi:hypothetical protein
VTRADCVAYKGQTYVACDEVRGLIRDLEWADGITRAPDCTALNGRSMHEIAWIASEALARGTIDGASVYPREVVKAALKHGAAAIIFAHNHPSGVPEPSAADRVITERLRTALQLVDIRVLDHFVVGDGEPVSFAERGWI